MIIRKTEDGEELQIFYAEVYLPDRPDAHGDYIEAADVRNMAHEFLQQKANAAIDIQHDNKATPCYFVESFVARAGDPDFIEGAWVVGIKCPDDIWTAIKEGQLNGLSIEALVESEAAELSFTMSGMIRGETLPDPDDGHSHAFEVEITAGAENVTGRTAFTNGHSHEIRTSTVTEETDGHSHRFAFWDYANPEVIE